MEKKDKEKEVEEEAEVEEKEKEEDEMLRLPVTISMIRSSKGGVIFNPEISAPLLILPCLISHISTLFLHPLKSDWTASHMHGMFTSGLVTCSIFIS